MGYRIDYSPVKKIRNWERRTVRVPAMTGMFLLLFFFLVFSFWPEGEALLREILIPGDPDVTVMALEVFAEDLQNGEEFPEAFAAFCKRIQAEGNVAYR